MSAAVGRKAGDIGAESTHAIDLAEASGDILPQSLLARPVHHEDAVAGFEEILEARDMRGISRANQDRWAVEIERAGGACVDVGYRSNGGKEAVDAKSNHSNRCFSLI